MVKKTTANDAGPTAGNSDADRQVPGAVEDLEALAVEAETAAQAAQATQQTAVVTQQKAQERQAQDEAAAQAAEIAGLLCMVRDVTADMATDAGFLPEGRVVEIWTDERLGRIAAPLVTILQKHGGSLGQFMEQYGPYLALVAATAMPAVSTIKAVREHRAAKAETQPEAAPGGQQQPA
jgi:hypothetical protein